MPVSIFKNASILIVDDQEANIEVIEGFLLMQGYNNITTTTDPREVISLLKQVSPDLILLDLMMPHLSGYDVMEQIAEINQPDTYLPVLVLTADITAETRQRALAGGGTDFLAKPFDLNEVGLRIKNLLQTRYLHKQLEQQNLVLEEKVKARTTELEKKNQELEIARDKAEASNRLKTAFLQNISHEVRTPLNGILGFGNLLANPDVPAEEKQAFVPLLRASSNRLMSTITDYMDISLIVSGNMEVMHESVDLNSELEALESNFHALCLAKALTFKLDLPDTSGGITVATDPVLFRKMISHLVDNAVKYTQEGEIVLGYSILSGHVEFFISDTGIGIEKEAQKRIFENFEQEDVEITRGHEGSGLGLSIVKGLCQLLGGEIRVESEKEKGATFFLSLPGVPDDYEVNTSGIEDACNTGDLLPVVLITDDDDISRYFLEFMVQEFTSEIYQARNGREAVELCRQHPEISLVLMDIKMPVMDGFEATREIRKFNKEVVIIAQTAFAHAGVREEVLEAGCNNYITKPVEQELLSALMATYFTTIPENV